MITGFNDDVEHDGRVFHVQSEDCGRDRPLLRSIVYHSGEIVAVVENSYDDLLLAGDCEDRVVSGRLATQHRRLIQAVRSDRLPGLQREVLEDLSERIERVRSVASRRAPTRRRGRVKLLLAALPLLAGAALWMLPAHGPTPAPDPAPERVAPAAAAKAVPPPVVELPAERPAVVVPPPAERSRREPIEAPRPRLAFLEPVAVPEVRLIDLPWLVGSPSPPRRPSIETPAPAPRTPRVDEGDLVELEAVDREPQPISRELPGYSKRARKDKDEGEIELKLLIDPDGVVERAVLVRGIDGSELTAATLNAAHAWRFRPASKDGVAVRVWLPVTLEFSIDSGRTRVRIRR